ncbi:MAG: hypothetical protein RIE08_14125, partial [Acidimicrobiales bacterium]
MTGTKRSERHRSLWLLLACLVAVAMFAAACGDDDDTASASDDGASDDGASDDGASDDGAVIRGARRVVVVSARGGEHRHRHETRQQQP